MTPEIIQNKINIIRDRRVMMDFDLAEIYGVENRRLKEQVRRNINRFPEDFMFELTQDEWKQLVANCDKLPVTAKHNPTMPFAFTQEGVAMLSGLLRSPTAVQVNINIMRAFVYMRQHILQSTSSTQLEELKNRIIALEERSEENLEAINDLSEDTQKSLDEIYIAFSELAVKQIENNNQTVNSRKPIGFCLPKKNCENL